MKNLLKSFVVVSLFFISCKKEPVSDVSAKKTEKVSLEAVVASLTNGSKNATAMPAPLQPKATEATPPSIMRNITYTAVPTAVTKGMNPAHGQPGHRCDIAVGAPLNSPPGKAPVAPQPAKTVVTKTPVVSVSTTNNTPALLTAPNASATPIVTAPGMNPPHGQEGHRCDIAVGAPLAK